MMTFPEISYKCVGENYQIEFLVDQRKCDLFQLLITILDLLEKNKDSL